MSLYEAARDSSLLFIVGTDRPERLKVEANRYALGGTTDLFKLLGKQEPFHRLQVTPNYFRHAVRADLTGYTCILNLITEPEDNGRVLGNLRKLLRGHPAKIVNRPEGILRSTRDQVSRTLAGIDDLQVPRAVRFAAMNPDAAPKAIEKAGLDYPVIVREAGTHTGRIVGCFDDSDSLRAALQKGGDHIATEFVDFRSADGIFRKYRVFFIGDRIIVRHMLASDHWNIHAKDRQRFMLGRPELIEEEKGLFEDPENSFQPEVATVLKAVRQRMGLDFFGMDFGFGRDGRVVLFEANATMNFFPFLSDPRLAHVLRCGPPAEAAFRNLLGLPPRRPAVAFAR